MIKWQAAKFKEETRKKRLLNRKNLNENQDESVDNQLFCSEDEGEAPGASAKSQDEGEGDQPASDELPTSTQPVNKDQPTNKRRKANRISAEERRGSLQLGLDIALSKTKSNSKKPFRKTLNGPTRSLGGRANRTRKSNIGESVHGKPQTKKRGSKANDVDFGSLFQTNIIADAHENSKLPVHTFTKKNKDDALAELIASIPTADREDAVPDKRLVREATRKFTRPAKSDGDGGWRIKGMATSLYSYQVRPPLWYSWMLANRSIGPGSSFHGIYIYGNATSGLYFIDFRSVTGKTDLRDLMEDSFATLWGSGRLYKC